MNRHSPAWISSTQPRKQRKYRYNAPLHTRGTFLHAHMSKELRAKHGIRSLRVRVGDKVRILRGQFKAREGKVERVDLRTAKAFVSKIELVKKDGATKVPYPLDASNLQIVELDTSDKRRTEKLKARSAAAKPATKPAKKSETTK
jgi:large subunit ribosomal protein L24